MCECTCSNPRGDIAFKTGESWVCIDAYMGCEECAQLIGVDVSVFTAKGALEYISDNPVPHIEPDDYGGPNGQKAACFELFSIDDLAEAATLLGFKVDEDYADWREFMDEYGLKWIQSAAQLCRIRNQPPKPEGARMTPDVRKVK